MAEKRFILVLDQGTTSSRALLINSRGQPAGMAQQEFKQIFPKPGWVEHDPREIWQSQLDCARQVLSEQKVSADSIAAIGITNQRETTVVWERSSGNPVGNAIVWQDRRTAPRCDKLKADGHAELIQTHTGLVPDAYFSATKLEWILNQDKRLRKQAESGDLLFGTIDSWLIWNLSGGFAHVTDASNASRTMLYNIHDLDWDEELLSLFDIPRAMLPEVLDSSGRFGDSDPELLGTAIPIMGVAGDQQAALFGQMCLKPRMVKYTYGTGCFIMMNTGDKPIQSRNNLLSTLAWRLDGKPTYALEGSVFMGGAVVQWLRDGLDIIKSAPEVETLAATVADSGGVYFVPAFTGLGAPYWDSYATGTLVGLERGTTSGHIARAALEAIAFQSRDVLDAMVADSGMKLRELRVDGGACANDMLMQFQADLLDLKVDRPSNIESTALGAGYLAGLASGFWPDIKSLADIRQSATIFEPRSDRKTVQQHLHNWHRAVDRARGWLPKES